MRHWLRCAVILLLTGSAAAQDKPAQVSLTIYNGDVALVRDERQMTIPAGRTRLEFKDVSARIRPETVSLAGPGLRVVEQNFDYDLLTPSKMMEKAVGKQVQIVRTITGTGKETTETATVLSANSGVVLRIGNRIEVLRDDGIPTRVIFNGIPENLRARPTLSVTVESQNAGPRTVTLSYLTSGLRWTADYVAQFDEKQEKLDLQGWVTLNNTTGTSFTNVTPRLVAGTVATSGERRYASRPISNAPVRQAGTGQDTDQEFPIYSLPERVTVAEQQTKQISFLTLSGLKARKIYEYRVGGFSSDTSPSHATVAVTFSNTGRALPTGTVRVYMRDDQGTSKFSGEQNVPQTPAGSELAVTLGEAFDITVQRTLVLSEKLSRGRTRNTMRYELRNARSTPAIVELRQEGLYGRDSEVSDESLPGKKLNASTRSWSVPVPANGETTLTFSAVIGG